MLQAAEHALAATKSALVAEAKTDEAHAAAFATHIDGLRAREARIEGPLDCALHDLVDVTSALALAEENLTQWRARKAPERSRVRDGTLAAYVAARDKSIAALARARASVDAAKLANGSAARGVLCRCTLYHRLVLRAAVCRAAETCFSVIHVMCEEASKSDLNVTCVEAFKLLKKARISFDVSRLGVLYRRTDLEKKTAAHDAEMTMAAALGGTGEALMRDALGLVQEDKALAAEQASLDVLDATLTDVEAVVVSKARELELDLGVMAAREEHESKVARVATSTAKTLVRCYEEMGRSDDTRPLAGLRERLSRFTVRCACACAHLVQIHNKLNSCTFIGFHIN